MDASARRRVSTEPFSTLTCPELPVLQSTDYRSTVLNTATRRPNVLLIMADQLAASFLPVYGHRVVQTPNIDTLAMRGMVFDSAYTNSPLCAPSRFSMLAGRLNSKIGAYDNAAELSSAVPTFAHYLRRAGYQTTLAGKMHFVGADQLHGFEERLTTDIYPADFGWTPNWDDAQTRVDWWFHNMDSVRCAGVADSSNQLDYDDEVGFHAVRKLRDLARSSDERPWLLTAAFTHPHDPYVARLDHWNRYEHDAIDLPAVGPMPTDKIDPHSARLRNVSDMDAMPITEAHIRNARHAYYSSISYIDDWVGALTRTLDECGQADNTIVIFTSDHGDMLGERGLWYKMNFFENACRVPLIVTGCGITAGRNANHVSLLDLVPTLNDLAGAEPIDPTQLDGQSLVPLLGGDDEADRIVLGEYLAEGAIAPIFMIRRGPHKYVACSADPEQLFNVSADPTELVNLASLAESEMVLAEFRSRASRQWDHRQINQDVLASQRSRRVVDAALRQGRYTPWDFQPKSDASQRFMRNHLDLNVVESSRRFPKPV
jgi:choline-sulfatase